MDERFTSLCRLDHTIHLGDQFLPVATKLEWEWWQEGGKIGGGGGGGGGLGCGPVLPSL